MGELILTLIRYRGEYVVLGRNQAMKMLLGRSAPKGVINMWGTPLMLTINGQFSSHIHRIEGPEQAHTVPLDAQIASVNP
jgi:hypothetical protein